MKKKLTILALSALIILPLAVFAQNRAGQDNACQRISNALERIGQKTQQEEEKIRYRQEGISQDMDQKRIQREQNLEQKREQWDNNRAERFQKLLDRAQDETQKKAVLDFIASVEEAVLERREKFDEAIRIFHEGTDNLKARRREEAENRIQNYKEKEADAFEEALSDCGKGSDMKDIQQNLRNTLTQARQTYRERIQTMNHGQEMQELADTKRGAMESARDEFHNSLREALDKLRVGFPVEETEIL